jgi:hypothetical protein
MYNPVDTTQIRAMVDQRREQLATDAERVRQAMHGGPRSDEQPVRRVRFAVGTRMIRIGARIAGVYVHESPRLRPGV